MPAAGAPAPAPGKGGLDLKRLPKWAWGVAIAGGAVVGFFLLKKPAGSGDEGAGDEEGSGSGSSAREGENPVVTSPLSDDLLGALGLRPPTGSYSGGDGGGQGDGGGFTDTGLGPVGPGGDLTPAQSSSQAGAVGAGPTQGSSSTGGSSAGAVGAGPTQGGTSSGSSSSGGGGRGFTPV